MSCGIYKITNQLNYKSYIGQSINIEKRWQKHLRATDNFVIHQALKKYGSENFLFEILEECLQSELNDKEKFYIEKYNTIIPNGYNMIPGGSNGSGLAKAKKVELYNLQGKFIKSFPSTLSAAQETGINASSICSCCNGKIQHTKEWQWKYSESDKQILDLSQEKIIIAQRKVFQYDLQGNLLNIYNNLKEASELSGISKPIICKVCNFKGNTAGGFVWRYEGDDFNCHKITTKTKEVEQYDTQLNLLKVFNSITEAAQQTGGNIGNIQAVCNGKRKTANGFIWKYKYKNN